MDPIEKAKLLVAQWYNKQLEESPVEGESPITSEGVKVVWFCYILGGWKTLLIVNAKFGYEGAKYYEVTYNTTKRETYLDVYMKLKNVCIQDGVVNQPHGLDPAEIYRKS